MGKVFALIGHPVGHSLSPLMHNDAFLALALPHHYVSFDVKPDDLKEAVSGIKALGIAGFNVTVPHKVSVMRYLDEIEKEAKQIGAVNTVSNRDGKLIGTNTDGRGYLLSLKEKAGENLKEKRVLLIGAGGAARGVAVTLDRSGVGRLDIANRTFERAKMLIETGIHRIPARALTLEEAAERLGDYDVIVNTTSVGMSPNVEDMPLPVEGIRPGTILSDLIYNPLRTKWLLEGERRGGIVMNGVGMFIEQGALAFEEWTGVSPDRERMRKIVVDELTHSGRIRE